MAVTRMGWRERARPAADLGQSRNAPFMQRATGSKEKWAVIPSAPGADSRPGSGRPSA